MTFQLWHMVVAFFAGSAIGLFVACLCCVAGRADRNHIAASEKIRYRINGVDYEKAPAQDDFDWGSLDPDLM